jgi:hypothetical protein
VLRRVKLEIILVVNSQTNRSQESAESLEGNQEARTEAAARVTQNNNLFHHFHLLEKASVQSCDSQRERCTPVGALSAEKYLHGTAMVQKTK